MEEIESIASTCSRSMNSRGESDTSPGPYVHRLSLSKGSTAGDSAQSSPGGLFLNGRACCACFAPCTLGPSGDWPAAALAEQSLGCCEYKMYCALTAVALCLLACPESVHLEGQHQSDCHTTHHNQAGSQRVHHICNRENVFGSKSYSTLCGPDLRFCTVNKLRWGFVMIPALVVSSQHNRSQPPHVLSRA